MCCCCCCCCGANVKNGRCSASASELSKAEHGERLLIYRHPALVGLVREYAAREGVSGATRAQLSSALIGRRAALLAAFNDAGLSGLHNFLRAFIPALLAAGTAPTTPTTTTTTTTTTTSASRGSASRRTRRSSTLE
jgi:hypothetical protein